ncbi:hypothetical protein FF124_19630 [Martelella lutilitoris]|uniref:Uncharacterized protein n=1 Tax=Martelella lutilitoris TaxID=2583532 RepID=A0A5C4JLB8_9HYPH|nr:hypothetical protein FF124_19630 [Martelella lutilitoris]
MPRGTAVTESCFSSNFRCSSNWPNNSLAWRLFSKVRTKWLASADGPAWISCFATISVAFKRSGSLKKENDIACRIHARQAQHTWCDT